MPKIIALTAIVSAVFLSSAAQAYSYLPTFTVMDVAMGDDNAAAPGEICIMPLEPALAELFAVPQQDAADAETSLACVQE